MTEQTSNEYHTPPMSDGLPVRVPAYRLAQQSKQLAGRVALTKLLRLQELLANSDGAVDVLLQFGLHSELVVELRLELNGQISLVCQRCLQPCQLELAAGVVLGLFDASGVMDTLADGLEPVEVDDLDQVELVPIIEDEILLALPSIAMHVTGECHSNITAEVDGPPIKRENSDTESPNPFGVLAGLKPNRKK